MSSHWIDPSTCRSLAVLVESVIGPMLMQHSSPVCLDLDIDLQIEVPGDATATVELIRALTRQSLEEMPEGGDLTVTVCETAGTIDLEMADTGCDIEHRIQRIPMTAAVIGAQVSWQNCPQGGAAVTVSFPIRTESLRKVA